MSQPARTRAAPAPRSSRTSRRGSAGGTLLGIFIGLVLGLGLAAGVVFFVTGGWKAYQSQLAAGSQARDAKETGKQAKADADKPRFDFYKILPGNEEPKIQADHKAPDRALADKAAAKGPDAVKTADKVPEKAAEKAVSKTPDTAPDRVATADPAAKSASPAERFWLQAGSFAAEPDAENLKARLALAGWEANVQQGVLSDKSVRYRVRLGPYDNTVELNRVKGELGKRGFDVAVIKY